MPISRVCVIPLVSAMLTVMILDITLYGNQSAPSPLGETILIRAKVIKTEDLQNEVLATCEITDIYCGAKSLRGHKFVVSSSKNSESTTGYDIYPPLTMNENGLWLLYRTADGKLSVKLAGKYGVLWPAREGVSARYTEAREVAVMLARLDTSPVETMAVLLKEYAVSKVSEVSSAAIHLMADSKVPEYASLVKPLVEKNAMCIAGQVAADEELCKALGDAWMSAKQRNNMISQWVTGRADLYNALAIMHRLDRAFQIGQLTYEEVLSLMVRAVENSQYPLDVRMQVCTLISIEGERAKDTTKSFDVLAGVASGSYDVRMKTAAVYGIGRQSTLTGSQIAVLKGIGKQSTDAQLTEAIDTVLARANAKASTKPTPMVK